MHGDLLSLLLCSYIIKFMQVYDCPSVREVTQEDMVSLITRFMGPTFVLCQIHVGFLSKLEFFFFRWSFNYTKKIYIPISELHAESHFGITSVKRSLSVWSNPISHKTALKTWNAHWSNTLLTLHALNYLEHLYFHFTTLAGHTQQTSLFVKDKDPFVLHSL